MQFLAMISAFPGARHGDIYPFTWVISPRGLELAQAPAGILTYAGHKSVALDLPGHGRDRTAAHKVTLKVCVDAVLACIEALPAEEDIVLVAHSRNGIVISQLAEMHPRRIFGLVYLRQPISLHPVVR